ncbi:MAG: efflux RND transporter periplasmic adaptor subunit [Polyangiales bacterium]
MNPHESHPSRPAHTAPDDLGFELPEPARPGSVRLGVGIGIALVVLAAGFCIGYLPRLQQGAALAHAAHGTAEALTSLDVVQPKISESTRPVQLTATLQPLEETVLYSRANGYVAQWRVDIGEQVKAGQLMAVIETPELDQQLDQARAEQLRREAALGQARAQNEYAHTSLGRYERLRPAGVASQQELDQRTAEAHVAETNVAAAAANIEVGRADMRRLSQLKSFSRIIAPFNGIVTQRSIDRGALVTGATALYRVANMDVLRAFLQVPQDLAVQVRAGTKAEVNVREYPGRKFNGELTRSAGALDPTTRTMTTEIRIDNSKHELLAGMYVQAALSISTSHKVFELPATALWNDAQGLRVAVVDAQDHIRFRTITLERDAGATLQIASGLNGDERVVKLASAGLQEGDRVSVRAQQAPSPKQ